MRWRSRSEKNSRPSNGREESPVTVVNAFEGCGIECRGDDGAMGGFAEVCAELANGTKSTIPIRAAQMLARTTIIVASHLAWTKKMMVSRRWNFWSGPEVLAALSTLGIDAKPDRTLALIDAKGHTRSVGPTLQMNVGSGPVPLCPKYGIEPQPIAR